MNNKITNVEILDAEVKEKVLEPSAAVPAQFTEKELMDALIKQASFAEDYYCKLVSQFEENLRKRYAQNR